MATMSAYDKLTLLSYASRMADGNLLAIAEILARSNPILNQIPFREANGGDVEKIARRITLPTGQFRSINQGISSESSQTAQVIEPTAMLEARSKIDVKLVDGATDPQGYRESEDVAFIEGLGQTAAATLFYGNRDTDDTQFTGFAPRYNALSDANVFGTGGSGSDLTSIYVVKWGINYAYGIFPRGSKAGLEMTDLGEMTVMDANSKEFQAYVSLFEWTMGLAVKDPRAIKRICNIETAGSSNTFDDDLLIRALNETPGDKSGLKIYVNSTIKTQMDIYAKDKTNVSYGFDQIGGVDVTTFKGIEVVQCDGIVDTEEAVA